MKFTSFFLSLLLASVGLVRANELELKPVMNPVRFEGDYVTFREAQPKFRPVHTEQPAYPTEWLQRGVEGCAVVAFLVDRDGRPTQCQVVEASDVAFGEAAVAAIARWRFSAPEFGGKPGAILMQLPIEFTIPAQKVATTARR